MHDIRGEAQIDARSVATMILPPGSHRASHWTCTACQADGRQLPISINGHLIN